LLTHRHTTEEPAFEYVELDDAPTGEEKAWKPTKLYFKTEEEEADMRAAGIHPQSDSAEEEEEEEKRNKERILRSDNDDDLHSQMKIAKIESSQYGGVVLVGDDGREVKGSSSFDKGERLFDEEEDDDYEEPEDGVGYP